MLTEEKEQKVTRTSNIELLRIIAMIMIIAHHFAVHSGFDFTNVVNFNRIWIQFIGIGGKIGVNIFVLISGYFLINAERLKITKVLKLWGQVFFYSVVIFFIFVLIGQEPLTKDSIMSHIAPITYSQWWFASAYFTLYLLSPFLNRLLRILDHKQYVCLVLLFFAMWCIVPTVTGQQLQSNSLLWFIFVYSIGGYIRLYGIETKLSSALLIVIAFACILVIFAAATILDIYGENRFSTAKQIFKYDMQRFPIFVSSLLIFLGFCKMNIRVNRFINTIASATFGVYLIHDYKQMRTFLWKTLLQNNSYSDKSILIPYSILVIALVFVVCTIIELIRIYLLERNLDSINAKIAGVIENIKERFLAILIRSKKNG